MNWRGEAGVREPKSMLFQLAKAGTDNGQTREGERSAQASDIYKGGSAEFGEGLWVGEVTLRSRWQVVTLNLGTMCD